MASSSIPHNQIASLPEASHLSGGESTQHSSNPTATVEQLGRSFVDEAGPDLLKHIAGFMNLNTLYAYQEALLPLGIALPTDVFAKGLANEHGAVAFGYEEDREVLLLAAAHPDGPKLADIPDSFKNDIGILKEIIKRDPMALLELPPELRNNRELVLQAVAEDGFTLIFLDEASNQDIEIAKVAILNKSYVCRFISPELLANREFGLFAVSTFGGNLRCLSEALRNDQEVVLKAIETDPESYAHASAELRGNRDLAIFAVREDYRNYNEMSPELKNNPDFVKFLVRAQPEIFRLLDPEMQNRSDILIAAGKNPKVHQIKQRLGLR